MRSWEIAEIGVQKCSTEKTNVRAKLARTFSSKEAKALMQKHLEIKKKAAETVSLQQTYRHRILKVSDHLINAEIIRLLRQIPVEEVNRDKKGIRVKALRNAEYHNIADVYTASDAEIASVKESVKPQHIP